MARTSTKPAIIDQSNLQRHEITARTHYCEVCTEMQTVLRKVTREWLLSRRQWITGYVCADTDACVARVAVREASRPARPELTMAEKMAALYG